MELWHLPGGTPELIHRPHLDGDRQDGDDLAVPERTEQSRERLAAALRPHRSSFLGIAAVIAVVLFGLSLAAGGLLQISSAGLLVISSVLNWWSNPQTALRRLTEDAVVLRQGFRARTIPRADVLDVQPKYGSGYGVELTLRSGDPLLLPGTARRFSSAVEHARQLRRWAGLDPVEEARAQPG